MSEGDVNLLKQTLHRLGELALQPSHSRELRAETLRRLRIFYCELQDLVGSSSTDIGVSPVAAGGVSTKGSEEPSTGKVEPPEVVPKAGASSKPDQEEGGEKEAKHKKHRRRHKEKSRERTPEEKGDKEGKKKERAKSREKKKEKKSHRDKTPEQKGVSEPSNPSKGVKEEKEISLPSKTPERSPVKRGWGPKLDLREIKEEPKEESATEESRGQSECTADFAGSGTSPAEREDRRERSGDEREEREETPDRRRPVTLRRRDSRERRRRDRSRTPVLRERETGSRRSRSRTPRPPLHPPVPYHNPWHGWSGPWWAPGTPAPSSGPPGNFYPPRRSGGVGKGRAKRERQQDIHAHGPNSARKIWRKTRPPPEG